MKMPTKCPFCKGPLCSTFDHVDVQHASCNKKLSHNVEFIANYFEPNYCAKIHIKMKPLCYIEWNFFLGVLSIYDKSDIVVKRANLPFFEPDLTNFNKLLDKVKTYLLFS